jgi:hypothetical protein
LKRWPKSIFPTRASCRFNSSTRPGKKQEKPPEPKYPQYYEQAEIIAGDFHFMRQFMPDRLDGKIVLTNTVTAGNVEDLASARVAMLITTTPEIAGRSFGTNVWKRRCLALLGKKLGATSCPPTTNGLLRELHLEPRVTDGGCGWASAAPLALAGALGDHALHRRCRFRISRASRQTRVHRIPGFAWRSARTPVPTAPGCCSCRTSLPRWRLPMPAGIYTLALVAPAHEQDPVWAAVVGAVWILASSALLYAGVRPTALVTLVALALEIGVLLIAALAAALHAPVPAHAAAQSSPLPASFGVAGFVTAMTLAVWMSDGWEVSASTSEEVNGTLRPPRGAAASPVSCFRPWCCLRACLPSSILDRCRASPIIKPTRWPTWARCSAARGGASRSW